MFRRGALNFVNHVPSRVPWVWCHCVIVPLYHQVFSRWYFVGPKFFLVGMTWVQNFSLGYFVGLKLFFVGMSWGQNFFSWVFHGSIFLVVANFVIQGLSVFGFMRKSDRK